jgi:alpha-tubulin suppressor-like RCC1 family protein
MASKLFEWKKNSGDYLDHYEVSKDGGITWIDVGTNTSYEWTDINTEGTYTFKVRALNARGEISNEIIWSFEAITELELVTIEKDKEYFTNYSCKQIALVSNSVSAIDMNDQLWLWGRNKCGECDIPPEIQGPGKVKQVALGDEHSAAIDMNNQLWLWGIDDDSSSDYGQVTNMPTETDGFVNENIKQVSLGSFHSAAIDENGKLWIWGYDYYGQVTNMPTETDGFVNENIKQVSLGGYHSAAIDQNDQLWMWGNTNDGRCDIPPEIQGPGKVKQVSLGDSHSAALDMNGKLFVWGRNDFGQCNIPIELNNNNIQKVLLNSDGIATCIIDENGKSWSWRDDLNEDTHKKLELPLDFNNINVQQIFETHNNMAALDADGKLWVWGYYGYELCDIPEKLDNYKRFEWVSSGSLDYYEISKDEGTTWENIGTNNFYDWYDVNIHGTYTFKVRGIDISGNISNEIEWIFDVEYVIITSPKSIELNWDGIKKIKRVFRESHNFGWIDFDNKFDGTGDIKNFPTNPGPNDVGVQLFDGDDGCYGLLDLNNKLWLYGDDTGGRISNKPSILDTNGVKDFNIYGQSMFAIDNVINKIYFWGSSGLIEDPYPDRIKNMEFKKLGNINDKIACGIDIDDNPIIWGMQTWLYNDYYATLPQELIDNCNGKVKDIKCTHESIVVIGTDDKLYSWGQTNILNYMSQDFIDNCDRKVKKITSTISHSYIIGWDDKPYIYSDTSDENILIRINKLKELGILDLSVINSFGPQFIALDLNNRVWITNIMEARYEEEGVIKDDTININFNIEWIYNKYKWKIENRARPTIHFKRKYDDTWNHQYHTYTYHFIDNMHSDILDSFTWYSMEYSLNGGVNDTEIHTVYFNDDTKEFSINVKKELYIMKDTLDFYETASDSLTFNWHISQQDTFNHFEVSEDGGNTWITNETNTSYNLINMSIGSYTFKVKGIDDFGNESNILEWSFEKK